MENSNLPNNNSHGLKRKRDCKEESSEMDNAEASSGNASTIGEKGRKRKFNYNFGYEAVNPKKCRFYYLNEQMTKPRRSRIIKETKLQSLATKKQKLHFVRSDNSGNAYLVYRGYQKADAFFTDEIKCNFEACKKLDLSFHIVDEIALEGLDGITLEGIYYFLLSN